jgi:hypothetical protein
MPSADKILGEHKALVDAIEKKLHVNLYEHKSSLVKFVGSFILFAALGTVAGGLLDRLIVRLQNNQTQKGSCAKFLFVNVFIDGLAFYLLFAIKYNGLQFDDWLMGTFDGFIFALALFNTQEKLTANMQCLVI